MDDILVNNEESEERIKMVTERDQILDEIAKRDYRALKAIKLGKPLNDLYPGESEWYERSIDRFNELEIILGSEP